ncbi:Chymotrypsin-like elastase family member 1 [Seminavis robusta]|uniref:Chymotrypsin-like elastase family member 1 n=1 Tax=Seminavis robusta TaxID=568900 RepID=A0A9N8E1T1_9STRA|nr:Chymotrypsin-like elastase family member 1 [Seminavis robusta]|eukprot:Sro561_g166850.1 Chymotrypsin-like elastase family member 1 (322) ;mRNA; r:42699-43664
MRLVSSSPAQYGILLLGCLLVLLPNTAECGRAENVDEYALTIPFPIPFPVSNPNTIVNGDNANVGEFPWYCVFAGGVLCGATLVHEDIVVTAAHCIDGSVPPRLRCGATTTSNGVLVDVEASVTHPQYKDRELANDIAILKLANPLSIQVADFNTDEAVPAGGSEVTAMGFGRTEPDTGGGSQSLQKLQMEALSDAECAATFPDYEPSRNICVDENNAGICFGDSGSPLVNDAGLVLGVASFVIQSCDSRFPDFFTRISTYSNWLQRSICSESDNPPDADCENVGDDDGDGGGGGGDGGIIDIITGCITFWIDLCGGLLDF